MIRPVEKTETEILPLYINGVYMTHSINTMYYTDDGFCYVSNYIPDKNAESMFKSLSEMITKMEE